MKITSTILRSILILSLCLPAVTFADTETTLKSIDKSIRLREYDQAVKLLQPLLKQNNAEAQYRMAGLYRSGTGIKKDMDKALTEYRKASENGLDNAQYALASLLEKQGTTKQQMSVIRKWYQAAADQGHRKAIRKLASLDSKTANKNTDNVSHDSIFGSIRNNALDHIKSLIEQGVDMDFKDNNGRTPLMVALLVKQHEMSQLLIPVSSQLDAADTNNNRALHFAASNDYADIVLELIRKQVNIDAIDGLGNTALIIATHHENKKIMSLLLEHQADHSIQNKKKQSAPQLAQTLDLKQAKLLFKEFNIKLPEINTDYAKVDIKAFQSNIVSSSSLYKGWPLINIASLLGETAIVGQLLDQGVDINATDSNGNTALHRAASKGQLKTVELLLSRKSNINALNHKHQTALYIAASAGQLKVTDFLLKKGADTSLIAKNKNSPLAIAIINKHKQIALSLATAKLDDASIHSALLLAIQNDMDDISVDLIKRDKLLVFAYAKNRSALWHSANSGLIKATRELLKSKSIDINLTDKTGYTALARAINNGFEEITSLLLKQRASTDILTHENNTMLMLAVLSENPGTLKQILQQDHDINAKNKLGNTALMLAAGIGNTNFVKQLIKSGADIQTRNKDDLNAFQIARNSGHETTANLIKESSGRLFKLFN